ncbi:uncharacterized protein LOC124654977 [Lolium rigidum]|uniref:uncharacterized protein LOC124654977 n=1 Tax=Lolium rigidum TaxID=89674 RepID=UPI001F5DE752|nr:uncharacterized protein LOC124654977 [Lolium rigidum]XP_047049906.1 uncharacterized protein LOC124654977 [Lolium rigidum]
MTTPHPHLVRLGLIATLFVQQCCESGGCTLAYKFQSNGSLERCMNHFQGKCLNGKNLQKRLFRKQRNFFQRRSCTVPDKRMSMCLHPFTMVILFITYSYRIAPWYIQWSSEFDAPYKFY